MFKLTGSILVMCSTIFISSQKVLECYCTYRFMQKVTDTVKTIQLENTTNIPYLQLFQKIGFDKDAFFAKSRSNGYILRSEIDCVCVFFDNLGKRDKLAEKEYLGYNIKIFETKYKEYYSRFNQIKRTHIMCGAAAGLFIIIFLI